ncbi:MAG TPA: fumarate hydratase C-terminal domain-containing protein [Thermomicrobiales bacterium]|nr:fumarate hydratase C-terminal domain-containing protein [Thermomicrobiales bacterium]
MATEEALADDLGANVIRLTAPLDEATTRRLRVGDRVLFDGIIWGIRDATLIRIFDQGVMPPVDLTGAVLLHTAPSVRKRPDGGYDPVSVGTTTSTRMSRFTRGCLHELGARAIMGKAGLNEDARPVLAELGGVYFSLVGGAASIETVQIEAIEAAYFEDLLPECLWKFRVKDFGPVFVTMDAHGNSAYGDARARTAANMSQALARLGLEPR